jgi:hypothetical protein
MVSILQPFRLILDPFNQERMTVRHERSTLRTADCGLRTAMCDLVRIQCFCLLPAPSATNFSPHTALLNTLFFVSNYHIWALQIA